MVALAVMITQGLCPDLQGSCGSRNHPKTSAAALPHISELAVGSESMESIPA